MAEDNKPAPEAVAKPEVNAGEYPKAVYGPKDKKNPGLQGKHLGNANNADEEAALKKNAW